MSDNDSFNDSDEVFNLYSSKEVIKTFKTQLKKIANNHATNTALSLNHEDNRLKIDKRNTDKEIHPHQEQCEDMEVIFVSKPTKISEVETPITPIDLELDDSLEIISIESSENTPRTTRRSARLRNKKGQLRYEPTQSLNITSVTLGNKRNTTTGKKGFKKNKHNKEKISEITLENSPQSTEPEDELNPEISVKVIWKSVNIKKFQMRKFQRLSYLFEQLSKEENIPEDKIILTFNDVNVRRSDTPDSLNLQVYHFLDGGVLSESSNSCQTPKSNISKCDSDSVTLKFQDINKKIIQLNLNKKEKLKVGMIKCSEQLEIPLNKIKFYFDGELLEPSETPESLGLENEEVIDIKVLL